MYAIIKAETSTTYLEAGAEWPSKEAITFNSVESHNTSFCTTSVRTLETFLIEQHPPLDLPGWRVGAFCVENAAMLEWAGL